MNAERNRWKPLGNKGSIGFILTIRLVHFHIYFVLLVVVRDQCCLFILWLLFKICSSVRMDVVIAVLQTLSDYTMKTKGMSIAHTQCTFFILFPCSCRLYSPHFQYQLMQLYCWQLLKYGKHSIKSCIITWIPLLSFFRSRFWSMDRLVGKAHCRISSVETDNNNARQPKKSLK